MFRKRLTQTAVATSPRWWNHSNCSGGDRLIPSLALAEGADRASSYDSLGKSPVGWRADCPYVPARGLSDQESRDSFHVRGSKANSRGTNPCRRKMNFMTKKTIPNEPIGRRAPTALAWGDRADRSSAPRSPRTPAVEFASVATSAGRGDGGYRKSFFSSPSSPPTSTLRLITRPRRSTSNMVGSVRIPSSLARRLSKPPSS